MKFIKFLVTLFVGFWLSVILSIILLSSLDNILFAL